ncbi:MAG: hypothetical protein MO852_05500 [Candidatus Devosia euplotis]|nr:hypothetical protein [Candidatus Devosia euplotis]
MEQWTGGGMVLHGACLPLPVRQNMTMLDEAIKAALLLAGLQMTGDS